MKTKHSNKFDEDQRRQKKRYARVFVCLFVCLFDVTKTAFETRLNVTNSYLRLSFGVLCSHKIFWRFKYKQTDSLYSKNAYGLCIFNFMEI